MKDDDDSIVTEWDDDAEEFLPVDDDNLNAAIDRVLETVDEGSDSEP